MIGTETTVRTAMSPLVVGIVPDATVSVALRLMAVRGVAHLPVIADGRCLGTLYEADLLWHAWASDDTDPVRAVIRDGVPAIDVDRTLTDAAALMLAEHTDVLLVTDQDKLTGILTAVDALRGLTNT
ncbi:CBS domain-containing protein [Actinokineospora sp. PR83]|uniref:CBS domain-containing protein n=1 Tax=Actinokineospora sp. PR83 TaxID=2884908 RepID=UPI0027E1F050|nr:CBS domain-containing protein [Actinokineospora sp. PR83]MCG8917492.1 CBS domain-containing protein [Actinokineospora sp. PR83]